MAELNRRWHGLAVEHGVIDTNGEFLISVAGQGSGCCGRPHRTRARLPEQADPAGALGPEPGRPEFVAMSVDGESVLGASAEEDAASLITVDRVMDCAHRRTPHKARLAWRVLYMASMVPCMASKKVTVTIPEDLLEEIRAEADERGISAYVTDALRSKRDRDKLRELVHWLEEEHGPVTETERSTAYAELDDLDAEHERRRDARSKRTGEAA
ncbi:ribbon-helix-helix domain-containing protein [Kitasatospora indigofera]|uniref:ribbon-helix-helix domain-containing protein n=1 Tax=Kitasatospora indigofera TaxID=67307 RepID=UPI003F4BAC0C